MILLRILFAGINSISFAVLFNVRRQDIFWTGLCGMLGFAISSYFRYTGLFAATLLASIGIAAYSEVAARIRKKPTTVFLISGLLPIVPGGDMYRFTVFILQRQIDSALSIAYGILMQVGGIVIGIVLVSSIFKILSFRPVCPTQKM